MGKCKKRTLSNKADISSIPYCTTRQEAVDNIVKLICKTKTSASKKIQKSQQSYKEAFILISRFGIKAEELSEAGVCYEDLLALGSIID